MKILHMTLTARWFDMIASGEKKEEYREIKSYWTKRLNKHYDIVRFSNGYSPDSRKMDVEVLGITVGTGRTDWGAYEGTVYYCIELGEVNKINF